MNAVPGPSGTNAPYVPPNASPNASPNPGVPGGAHQTATATPYPGPPPPAGGPTPPGGRTIELGVSGHVAPIIIGQPRRRWVAGAVAAAVAFTLVAVGGVVGVRLWTASTGDLPEDVVPASTAAFARLNLSPGFGQRWKFAQLLEKFPGSGSADERIDDARTDLLSSISEAANGMDVSWLGDRVGVGIWPSAGDPVLLVVAASTDDEAATQALTTAQKSAGAEKFGFVVSGGYVLMVGGDTGSQTAAEHAVAEAGRSPLSDSEAFGTATDKLPGDEALLGWLDLDLLTQLDAGGTKCDCLSGFVTSLLDGYSAGLGPAGKGGAAQVTGKMVLGVRATDTGIELRTHTIGMSGWAGGAANALTELESMPRGSLVAAAITDDEFGRHFSQSAKAGLTELLALDGATKAMGRPITALVSAASAAKGMSVALTNSDLDHPALMVRVRTGNAKQAAALLRAWQRVGGPKGVMPMPAKVSRAKDAVTITTKQYRSAAGRLGESPRYRTAMADMPASPRGALFVDVQALLADADLPAEEAEKLAPVKAVAATVSADGEDATSVVRIVIE